jgi:hypothetical protein
VPSTSRSSWTWKGYRRLQILLNCLPLLGLAIILQSVLTIYHDRQSLQWPAASGTVTHCEARFRHGKHSGWEVNISYRFQANGQYYTNNRISLANPNGGGPKPEVNTFVANHPARSTVTVYFDPQHPQTAVLEPGAEEELNRVRIWSGGIIFVGLVFIVLYINRFFNKLVAWRKANPPKTHPSHRPEEPQALPHAFASYEPALTRKLNCIPDKDALDQFLGDDEDKALQAWTPDDRIIDSKGQEYRLVPSTNKTRYDLEPTGQTWTAEKLLDVAVADARLLKRDTDALRRQVTSVPEEKRIPVLMKCIDDLPAGPTWVIAGLILFLVLFFFAVLFGGMSLYNLFEKWRVSHH